MGLCLRNRRVNEQSENDKLGLRLTLRDMGKYLDLAVLVS